MSRLRWRPSDPGGFALRLALRTAIVLPLTFALGMATGNDETALFCAFGPIALLLFVDFGGPASVRVAAYVALVVAGAGLIALGTLCSQDTAAAAVAMAIVGFCVLFAGVLNGYLAAASSAALLTFILPVMVAGEPGDIPARLLGWAIAAAICIPATMLLLPARPRDRLRSAIADACRALAQLLAAPERSPQDERSVAAAVDAMHERFAATPFRPTGPTGATGALAELIDEVTWLHALTLGPRPTVALEPTPAERELRARSAAALADSAALVEGHPRELPDVDGLERGRRRVTDDLVARLADPTVREDGARLWAAIVLVWEARIVSFVTLDVARRALVAGGATGGGLVGWPAFVRRQGVALAASGRLAAAHAGVRSVWFRNSVRGATGLAAAVLLGHLLAVQHAFWVVLGTLSVLRSSALGTGATIVQALAGTAAGIAIGAPLLLLVDGDRAVLWAVLPFGALVSAYAPRAISFAAGQAGFTVTVFVIFDLIERTGWEVGIVRIEDVSIGFAISLLVGLLFWPRGAGALLRRAIADATATSARYLGATLEQLIAGATAADRAGLHGESEAAAQRLDAAFRQRLAERAGQELRLVAHTRLAMASARLRTTADAMAFLADRVGGRPRPEGAAHLASDAAALSAWFVEAARAIGERRDGPPPATPDPAAHAVLVDAVRDAAANGDRDATMTALALTWAGLHLDQLGRLEHEVAQASRQLRPAPERETPGW